MHIIIYGFILKVRAEKLYVEMDDIGKGIVELIYQQAIKKLVMGAAADKHYSEYKTTHFWFTGHLYLCC